ncbi:MAG TPA: endonuclease/exonuclease/phosphatase family protein [Polyangia bacterium]|jgi:endonuclease/exonuclease/phosphatase family metal-dependent hydrolase
MRLRVVTWNVHGCVGTDGRFAPGRTADALAELAPDVALLQEVGDNRGVHPPIDQATVLAGALGLHCAIGITMPKEPFGYGNCTLSRWPIVDSSTVDLSYVGREPRACLRAIVAPSAEAELRLTTLNVHLGLGASERRYQLGRILETLLADYAVEATRHHRQLPWLWRWRKVDVDKLAMLKEPLVLAGDFNDFPPGPVTRTLANRLADLGARLSARATFPSRHPLLRLDRLYASRAVGVARVEVVRSPLLRVASDHLPIVADVDVEALAPPLGLEVA